MSNILLHVTQLRLPPHQPENHMSLWQMELVGLSFPAQLYEKSIIPRHKNTDDGGVSDSVKLFCRSFLSAVAALSSAAESAMSTHTTAQSAAHPSPRSITKQAGNRWEEELLVIWSRCNMRAEFRVSDRKPPELHQRQQREFAFLCFSHILESLLVCSSLMLLVITVILATKLWKLHSKEVLTEQQ